MTYENIIFEIKDGVGCMTLNRAKSYNALSLDTLDELKTAFKTIQRDNTIRSVLLTGQGQGFSSGADLAELGATINEIPITDILRNGLNSLALQMRRLEKPIVAAVNGVAAGAGASLTLMADYRIASENASFVFAAFANLGLVPDGGGTYLLQQIVGSAKAFELVLFADAKNRVNAQQALELGIINRVVSAGSLHDEALAIATKLATMPTKAIGLTKKAIYRASERSLEESLDYEAQLQGIASKTDDFREGVAAFLEKRNPIFKGK